MRSLCVPVSLLLLAGSCMCMFPRPCANSEGLRTKECCPAWNGSACGVKSGRGKCAVFALSLEPHGQQYPYHDKDDREQWPWHFFNRTCNCSGNYGGFDCGECRFGYYGPNCSQYRDHVRKNVMALSAAEKKKLVDYFDRAKNTVNPDYVIATALRKDMGPNGEHPKFANATMLDLFAWIHYYVTHPTFLPNGTVFTHINFAHGASNFPVWHRVFLLHFENEIRKMTKDFDFSLPYWNWIDKKECDICTDDLMGAQDPHDPNLISPASPFSKWKGVCMNEAEYVKERRLCNGTREGPLRRNPGNNDEYPRLPTKAAVTSLMNFSNYDTSPFNRSVVDSFRNLLEGWADPLTGKVVHDKRDEFVTFMHNAVHMYLNGTMSFTPPAANDPIFYLHHCFIDSLFERWMLNWRRHEKDYPVAHAPIGHNFDFHMVPYLPISTCGVYFLVEHLGYKYDYLPDPTVDDVFAAPVLSDWSEWSDCTSVAGMRSSTRISADVSAGTTEVKVRVGVRHSILNKFGLRNLRTNEPSDRGHGTVSARDRCKKTPGRQTRECQCLHSAADGSGCGCTHGKAEVRACYNIRDCHMNGAWTDKWSEWSKCRPHCGTSNSKRFRERICEADYAASGYSENIHFHGRPHVDCGQLPEGEAKNETQACPFNTCLTGTRFALFPVTCSNTGF